MGPLPDPPGKPRKNLRVTKITTAINRDHQQEKQTRRRRCLTAAPSP